MRRRAVLAAASAAFFSSACGGGGGSDPPRIVTLHGDSLTYGGIPGGRLPVPPGTRLGEMLPGWVVRDYSANGDTIREAWGETVLMEGRPFAAGRLPYPPMPQHIAATDADTVLMRYGGADCLLGTPLDRFSELLTRTVETARAAGKRVYLAGVYDHPAWGFRAFTDAARSVADRAGAGWIEMPAISHPTDLVDDLHPTQAMSDRWCEAMAQALKGDA